MSFQASWNDLDGSSFVGMMVISHRVGVVSTYVR